jgi:threonine dehydrogenase-like Zn-dependent dehydrogenase
MRCLWLENRELRYREDIEIGALPDQEALVKVNLAGICQTDLELVNGYYPFTGIIGHEFVGTIASAPDSPKRVGQRVVGEINAACGNCQYCLKGHARHCPDRTVLGIVDRNGAFADFLTLPLKNLIPIPDQISNEAAIFTEPLAAALQIQAQVDLQANDRILLIGAGKLGMLIAMSLRQSDLNLTVLVRHQFQQKLLHNLGVQAEFQSNLTEEKFDIVIDASGSRNGFEDSLHYLRPRGKLILKSTYSGETLVDLAHLVVDEIEIIGSRCGAFEPAIQLLLQNRIDPTVLLSERFPIEEGLAAFASASLPGKWKVAIEF